MKVAFELNPAQHHRACEARYAAEQSARQARAQGQASPYAAHELAHRSAVGFYAEPPSRGAQRSLRLEGRRLVYEGEREGVVHSSHGATLRWVLTGDVKGLVTQLPKQYVTSDYRLKWHQTLEDFLRADFQQACRVRQLLETHPAKASAMYDKALIAKVRKVWGMLQDEQLHAPQAFDHAWNGKFYPGLQAARPLTLQEQAQVRRHRNELVRRLEDLETLERYMTSAA